MTARMDDTVDFPVPSDGSSRADMPHTAEFEFVEPPPQPAPPDESRSFQPPSILVLGPALIVALVLLLFWSLHLHGQLPELRRGNATAAQLSQGTVAPDAPAVQPAGDWFTQSYGDERELVSNTSGSALRFSFYGTSLAVTARVGPESGRLYVKIDGQPLDGLRRDEQGSYVSLRASQAQDRALLLTQGLSTREHQAELSVGGSGLVALSDITVASEPPFPWALTLFEVASLGALATALLAIGRRLSDGRDRTETAPGSPFRSA